MSSLSTIIYPDVLRIISAAGFNGTFQAVGTPLTHATRVIKFQNYTNVPVAISWDGTTTHEFLPPNSFLLLDVSTNKENALTFGIAQNTQFYVLGTAAGTGDFYISSYYGK